MRWERRCRPGAARQASRAARRSACFHRLVAHHCRSSWSYAFLYARFQRSFHELIQRPIEHRTGVADLNSGAQILDARLVEHVGTDLITPADIGLGVLQYLRRRVALVDLEFVELRLQHLHRRGAVLVLAALILA